MFGTKINKEPTTILREHGQPEPEKEIGLLISALNTRLEATESMVMHLDDRLDPVCKPDAPEPYFTGPDCFDVTSPLAIELAKHCARISEINKAMLTLLKRLQLP